MPHLVSKAECVRTQNWSYIYRHDGQDELYNRIEDPTETTNLLASEHAENDGMGEIVNQLRNEMFDWLVETSDVMPWGRDPRFPEINHGWRDESS